VSDVIADAPKRAELLNAKQFNGAFGCSLCTGRCERTSADVKQLIWPTNLLEPGERRTDEQTMRYGKEVLLKRLTTKGIKGIKGISPLFKLDNFCVSDSVLPEYMHMYCSGIIKLMLSVTFDVKAGLQRPTKRNWRCPTTKLDLLMIKAKKTNELGKSARR
jgi:hypothetical protein